MALEVLKYIGENIKEQNKFFDTFGVNGIQLPGGEVIKFTENKEKQFIGISDLEGTAFYIRFKPAINYTSNERKLTSCETTQAALLNCRLVAFSFNQNQPLDPEKVLNKLLYDLKRMHFGDFQSKPQIQIKKSNLSYLENFTEETKQALATREFMCISIDFDLKYFVNLSNCECEDVFFVQEC